MRRKAETLYPMCLCKLNKFSGNVGIVSIKDEKSIFT